MREPTTRPAVAASRLCFEIANDSHAGGRHAAALPPVAVFVVILPRIGVLLSGLVGGLSFTSAPRVGGVRR